MLSLVALTLLTIFDITWWDMDIWMDVAGLVMLVLGVLGQFWIRSREFYRRNQAGVEEFSSFTHAVLSKTLEKAGLFICSIFVLFGAAMAIKMFFRWLVS